MWLNYDYTGILTGQNSKQIIIHTGVGLFGENTLKTQTTHMITKIMY
jgi:hypothetical protein